MLEQSITNMLPSGESSVPRGTGESTGSSWADRREAADEWELQHEAEWVRVDQKLRGVAARRAALDAEELKLWRGWGFGSLVEYMERAMGDAPHTASERLRVARALVELPLIEEALERGELAYSAVRELSRVAVPGADAANVGEIAGTVALASNTGAAPPRRTSGASSSPAYKIALKRCPDCHRGWQYAGGRDIEVDPAVLEMAACDAILLGSLDATVPERATTTVTPRRREQVLARDGHGCTVPGCRRNVGLDLHHIEYQSPGGGHALSNLTTLCDLHHRAVHFQKLVVRGAAPDRLSFEFRKPRDRRNVTDDDEPTAWPLSR